MIIQLQAPKGTTTDWVLNYFSKGLLALKRKHPEISRAHIYLRKPSKLEKLCSVSLTVRDVSLVVSRSAHSFTNACEYVLTEIEERLKLFFVKPVRKMELN